MDTIVAIATPAGRSAIGLVRFSGPASLPILRALTRDEEFNPKPNQVCLRSLFGQGSTEVLDKALVTFFQSPHSFTGEDMVEVSCHGSPIILRQLIDLAQQLDARLAEPGEFTLRALRNGKMNLSQAEAIRDVINAQTIAAATQATRQLAGELSAALTSAKNKLIDVIVRLESALEFVEDDLPQLEIEDLTRKLSEALVSISGLTETYRRGHLLQDGLRVAIVGRPNVGKSSLFNSLLRLDRAIVTDIAGTTRDSITEGVALQGVPVLLTDTAGIREASDEIEKIGVQRTNRAIADSDLLLIVLDGSQEIDENDKAVLKEASHSLSVVVVNKCDLPAVANLDHHCDFTDVVHVSALTGEGFEELTAAILEPFGSACTDNVGLLITNSRHYDLLRRTQNSLDSAMHLLSDQAGEELVLADLHNALRFLGEITGETTTEDILSEIFSTFCIGK